MRSASQKTGSLEIALNAKGWLTEAERTFLFKSAQDMGKGCNIVNIGVEYGASVVCFAEGAQKDCMIYAFDIDLSNWKLGNEYDNVAFGQGDSHQIVIDFIGNTKISTWVDLLFIDGDHSYEGVKKDLPWLSLVKPGGTVIFHDCYEWPPAPPRTIRPVSPEVNRAVSEWELNDRLASAMNKWIELEPVDSMRVFRRL